MFKRLFDIDPWKVKTTSLDRENRRLQESLTSIGNGYMGMRGNFEEQYTGDAHQGTYIAVFGIRIRHELVGGKMAILNILEK